jgi:hypothetical protein
VDLRIHQLLLSNDSPTDWEYPQGFDWDAAWRDVRQFLPAAEALIGQPLQVDDQVQDASYFAELFVFEEGAVRPPVTAMVFKIAIRFSSFGRMATIHTNSALSDLGRYPVERLAALLEEYGFVYIPAEALAEPYDGVMPDVPADFTWWFRFFDYM